MSIENSTIKDTPEKIKYVQEQKENFTDAEQKLIDDFSKNTGYEKIDPLNMDAETKKTGGEAHWSYFFEKNYKTISKNPEKYPKFYPLLKQFLDKNNEKIKKSFQERFDILKNQASFEEIQFIQNLYMSPTMQSWFDKNPEKNIRIAWDYFNELSGNTILGWIDNKERTKFSKYPDILKRVVEELYYSVDDNMQKNINTDNTKKQLKTIDSLLSSSSIQNPDLYKNFESIHKNTKNYLYTMNNQEIIENMKTTIDKNKYDTALKNFITIAKQKTQDPVQLQEAVIIIQPILQTIYDQGSSAYEDAKEEKDPLKKIELYTESKKNLKKIINLKQDSDFDFGKFEGTYSNFQTETNFSLAQGLINDIDVILSDISMIPILYDTGYKIYGEALMEKNLDTKKKKYTNCKEYFEKIMESKKTDKSYSSKINNIFIDTVNKLQNINNFLNGSKNKLGNSNVYMEKVDVADLPVYWGPSPFEPNGSNGDTTFHIYVGENKQQFDTIEIFDILGKRVSLYEIGKTIFPTSDTSSEYKNTETLDNNMPIQFELPLNEVSLSTGTYIFRISSKTTNIQKSEKFQVL